MTTRALRLLPFWIACLCAAGGAIAQEDRGVRIGPFRAVPTLGLTVSHEDNVLRSSANEVSSLLTVLSPGLQLERGDETRGLLFGYEGEFGRYSRSDVQSEDFRNHRAYAQFRSAPTARNRFSGQAGYTRGQDFRGETGAQQGGFVNLARAPDRYRRIDARVGTEFGAEGARGLLAGNLTYDDIEYRNNREFTQFRDATETGFDLMFGWRLAPKTRLTLGAGRRDVDFDRDRLLQDPISGGTRVTRFDSTETDLFLGLMFDATARTTGRMSIGRIEKDFDDPTLDDYSGTGWQIGLSWRPLTYSVLDLSASRQTNESDLVQFGELGFDSSFIVARDVTLAWSHAWNDRFKSSLDMGLGHDSYRASRAADVEVREHDLRFWGVGLDYQFRRWLQFGLGYKHYDRDASDNLFEYRRNVITLSVEGTLQ